MADKEELEEQIEDLRDQLEYAERELEIVREEKDKEISQLEFKVLTFIDIFPPRCLS